MVSGREAVRSFVLRSPAAPFRRFRAANRPVERADMVRIGTEYGGWAVPGSLIEASWTVYCGGVGLDATFDLGLTERYGCAVHAFDPTPSTIEYVKSLNADPSTFIFHQCALWSEDGELHLFSPDYSDSNFSATNLHGTSTGFTAQSRSLQSLMRELGHDRIDLLKLDIEGAEFAVLDAVIDGWVRPTVLCVEFHKAGWRIGQMVQTVKKLHRLGYSSAWVEGYNVTFVSGS
jgi:FkbM family methyltransferase